MFKIRLGRLSPQIFRPVVIGGYGRGGKVPKPDTDGVILLENGGRLLLESGGAIKLEK